MITVFRMSSTDLLYDALYRLAQAGFWAAEVTGDVGQDSLLRVTHTVEQADEVMAVVAAVDAEATPVE